MLLFSPRKFWLWLTVGTFHLNKTFKNLETAANVAEISFKSFQKFRPGNCWISEMRTIQPKILFGNFWKYCSIRFWTLPKIQTGRFDWMESAQPVIGPREIVNNGDEKFLF